MAIGGISSFTSDAVVANALEDSFESHDAVRAAEIRCGATDDVVLGDLGGSATDNRAASPFPR